MKEGFRSPQARLPKKNKKEALESKASTFVLVKQVFLYHLNLVSCAGKAAKEVRLTGLEELGVHFFFMH